MRVCLPSSSFGHSLRMLWRLWVCKEYGLGPIILFLLELHPQQQTWDTLNGIKRLKSWKSACYKPYVRQCKYWDILLVLFSVKLFLITGLTDWQVRKHVVICGQSMIFWGTQWAWRTLVGSQLRLCEWTEVEWICQRGLWWPGLLPHLFEEWHSPVCYVFLIQLGGNNLGLLKGIVLVV